MGHEKDLGMIAR